MGHVPLLDHRTIFIRIPGAEILDAFSVAPRFNQWMADTIRPYVRERVLEIGAGMGNLTRALARGKQRYIASDIDQEHLSRLRARLRHYLNVETRTAIFRNRAISSPWRTPSTP